MRCVPTAREVSERTSSWDPYARGCPSRDVLDQIGSKWAVLVLGELGRHGACRFTQLRQQLAGVSEKMLTQTLRTLERDGLLLRTVYPEVPMRVEYELTPLGQTLRGPLKALTDWSVQHIEEVLDARKEYDERAGKR
ncbi:MULTISPECIES: helix-turn-helix domain-containing protein [unclassified Micromonospora]|uniref:winged helix-turn-helix transcriptional regulator n=1 Tax=unclassified Micromonospora TaxID=2617518 RepID=UPI00098D5314|nr:MULTISPECIES: helix-turn-helix domain-containing protein [unclassified Micromonospora]MDI5938193.1 helix-turn-helix domain-containing protein [Micromonospora sp. DH15]